MKRPALQNKRVGVLRMAFRACKVFGSFEKLTPGFVYGDISPRDSCDIYPFFDFIVDHNFMRHFNMHGWCFCRWLFSFFCVLLQTTAAAFTFLWLQMHRLLSFFRSLSHFRRYGIFRDASVRWCCFYPLTVQILLIFRRVLFLFLLRTR